MEYEKNGIDDLYKAEIETDIENKHMDSKGEKVDRMNWEIGLTDIYIYTVETMYKIDN